MIKKTVKIEGMMCEHCAAAVKNALEELDGIESAEVSVKDGSAVIEMSKNVDSEKIKKAIEDRDYKFISIE
jgi:Cu2+-exporting ATPase